MTYTERYAKATNIAEFIFIHCGIVAEELNKETNLGYTQEQITDILKDKTRTAAFIAKLDEIENGFGCDPEYYGVSSVGAIAYHLRNEGYLPVEEESN